MCRFDGYMSGTEDDDGVYREGWGWIESKDTHENSERRYLLEEMPGVELLTVDDYVDANAWKNEAFIEIFGDGESPTRAFLPYYGCTHDGTLMLDQGLIRHAAK
jgi:hypothetical protein